MEIGDTSEEAVDINETTTVTESVEETEPAENVEILKKWRIKSWYLRYVFNVVVENLQFICDQCNQTNSSDKGLTQYMWMKKHTSNKFRH